MKLKEKVRDLIEKIKSIGHQYKILSQNVNGIINDNSGFYVSLKQIVSIVCESLFINLLTRYLGFSSANSLICFLIYDRFTIDRDHKRGKSNLEFLNSLNEFKISIEHDNTRLTEISENLNEVSIILNRFSFNTPESNNQFHIQRVIVIAAELNQQCSSFLK